MNIKVIVVVLIIGVLLCQIDAGRNKNRKKTADNTSEYTSSSGFTKNDDEDKHRKDKNREDKRDYKMREKKDKSSSSSEEDNKDKDERNGTAINVVNELQRAKRSEPNEQVQQSFVEVQHHNCQKSSKDVAVNDKDRNEHGIRVGRAAIQSSNSGTNWHQNGISGK